jgi:hypothetical protein
LSCGTVVNVGFICCDGLWYAILKRGLPRLRDVYQKPSLYTKPTFTTDHGATVECLKSASIVDGVGIGMQ